ncbi:UDP-N-acetyl glucosamine 2-epimerase [Candidatus Bipolaricaulota bacterium]|nr:UDP-N-acetyl glucosamine 2-epimerase [Candidatus Bipolaricaulota bacterium]
MKIVHIVGARPQFIKMSSISRAINQRNETVGSSLSTHNSKLLTEVIVHTGQHYDYELSRVFFEELHIPKPNDNLGVGSGGHGEQTGEMLKRTEAVLLKERPDIVLVYGDTNSTLAGALAAAKLHIPVAHVEAGLRSFNRRMPEEINRVLTDHVSDLLFCPTEAAVSNLRSEGLTNIVNDGHLVEFANNSPSSTLNSRLLTLDSPFVLNVGDVMFDSVIYNLQLAKGRSRVLKDLGLESQGYYLATVHRAENTDNPKRLKAVFNALSELATKVPVVAPLHPRTQKALSRYFSNSELSTLNSKIMIIEPISYLDMLLLEQNAKLILTDSGGVQKEAFILRVPCVTLREETEWTETVETGWNVLTGADKEKILKAVKRFWSRGPVEPQGEPYGDGHAAERIVNVIFGGIAEGLRI